MHPSAQPEDRFPSAGTEDMIAGTGRSSSAGAVGSVGDNSNGSRLLAETELDSALQLLVERAQYITGATGTALALPQGEEMVCRASAGSSAPAVGARLQVRSGLTGESISRRQLLRCDNAESDPRVNLETCRELGIASIVVLPLLRRNGEVRGLFELFSDHPYAFEERDLVALERMADLTLTALDLAEQRQTFMPALGREPEKFVEAQNATGARPASALPMQPEVAEPPALPAESPAISSSSPVTAPVPAAVPEAMLRVQKCAFCGFPVSEGRTLCLDCEKKDSEKKNFEKKQREREQVQIERQTIKQGDLEQDVPTDSATPPREEFVPAFLANSAPVQESWLTNHVNLLAIAVLILGVLVAVVVFR
jgi:putative methionine-R-sulfoxide reductase with GAF domain